jgi:hypothetical protein
MQRFRSMKALQKVSSIHPQLHSHFNQERHHSIRLLCRLAGLALQGHEEHVPVAVTNADRDFVSGGRF